jgi:hypothetical protein
MAAQARKRRPAYADTNIQPVSAARARNMIRAGRPPFIRRHPV